MEQRSARAGGADALAARLLFTVPLLFDEARKRPPAGSRGMRGRAHTEAFRRNSMLTTLVLPLLATLTAAPPIQWTTSCQDTNPRLERLAEAIQRGDVGFVRAQLD